MKKHSLNLFFDVYPDKDFLYDIEVVSKSPKVEVTEIIGLVLDWYPKEDIEKEWEEWSKGLKEEELKKKRAIIRAFLSICKEFASGKVNEVELREDFENLDLDIDYFNKMVNKIKDDAEFKKKASKGRKPYQNNLKDLDWRIDDRKYLDGTKEKVAVVEFLCSVKGENEVFQLDFTKKSLKHLILLLNKISEEL